MIDRILRGMADVDMGIYRDVIVPDKLHLQDEPTLSVEIELSTSGVIKKQLSLDDVGLALFLPLLRQARWELLDAIKYGSNEYRELWNRDDWNLMRFRHRLALLQRLKNEHYLEPKKGASKIAAAIGDEELYDQKVIKFHQNLFQGEPGMLDGFKDGLDNRRKSRADRLNRLRTKGVGTRQLDYRQNFHPVLDGWFSRGFCLKGNAEISKILKEDDVKGNAEISKILKEDDVKISAATIGSQKWIYGLTTRRQKR